MSDEQVFLAAAAGYRKKPSKTAALSIWNTYFGPQATRPLRVNQLIRSSLRQAIDQYEKLKAERDQAYGGFSLIRRIQRHVTAGQAKAQGSLFDGAAVEVERNLRLTEVQISTLELTQLRSHYEAEKKRRIADARLHDLAAGASAKEVAKAIQQADMTINFAADRFFGSEVTYDGYANMWVRGASPTDNVDTRERDWAERNMFDTFRYQGKFNGASRPLYAALNVGRRVEGAAGGYGASHFILKEAVKQRSTYAPSDTFALGEYEITDQALNRLRDKIDPVLLTRLRRDKGTIIPDRQFNTSAFKKYLEGVVKECQLKAKPGESSSQLADRKRDCIQDVAEACRVAGEEAKVIASFERMDRIVAYLEDQMLLKLATYANNPDAYNLKLPTYVEAQVHGPIQFSQDVERMVIARWEVQDDAVALANLAKFSTKHKVPYSFIEQAQLT